MPSGKSRPIKKVLGASALAILGSGLYYGYTEGKLPLVSSIPLEHIDETKFDSTDDVVVVLLGSKRRDQYPKTQVDRLKSILPKGVKVCYTVKEGSDTRNPPVMLYKGMRKQFYASIDLLDPSQFNAFKSEMASFFTPVSQDVASLRQHPQTPEYVTYNSFQDSVVRAATPRAPIVLQLYEQGCFLCFLMRPFINSVNRHLQEIKSPVRIKRLNIEANDFPKGCPVTRATPTFVLYDGHPQGTKWSEFKPRDFVKKLVEVAKLDSRSQAYLEGLTEDVSKRFMLFGRWAHWISQSQAIQELVLTKAPVKEEDVHSRVLSSLMALDMERVDDLETNLQCLADDIISAEQDCLAVVQIMANEILRAEKKQ
ncbi:thioredoxin [Babesia ovis]|uniref:Thioredoxin n=1 Tax=Babesia ovis TaxID=5869 RepID=A0A9W5WUH4_BABOV|nr:thioredoxin [Babesia ovis]